MSPGQLRFTCSGAAEPLQWSIAFHAETQTLLVQTRGPIEAVSLNPFLLAVGAALQELGQACQRLLVDHRASELLASPANIFFLPELISEHFCRPRGRRMAFVFSRMEANERFFENVLKNAGLLAAAFTQLETAQEWLSAPP